MAIGLATRACVGGPHERASEASPAPRVLVFTTLFPNPAQPRLGVFVRDRVRAMAAICPSLVIAPVLRRLARQLERDGEAAIPKREELGTLPVYHPRFDTLPGVGRWLDGLLLCGQTMPLVARLQREWAFDLIDAHYAFPDGMAAVLLGRRLGLPVAVTIRGGDIDLLPRFRMRRRMIQWTLQNAQQVIAVSEHLAEGASRLGVPRTQVRVVPNGIDTDIFSPVARTAARRQLGLPEDVPILLCVGNLTPEKGQHVLIDALPRLHAAAPLVLLVGGDQWGRQAYQKQLEQRAIELGVTDRLRIVGSRPQAELAAWYSAADIVVLPTFREGCPNAIREALACGTPVVASRVGGVPELVTSDAYGILVEPGDVAALADALDEAFRRTWDRDAIAAASRRRTWPAVGAMVTRELAALVGAKHPSPPGAQ